MSTAIQKITLSSSRDIPFNKLVLSQSNVRRVKAGVSLDELAESIARRGLIQSLHVRPALDAGGAETGMFEVPAGGRRYRALESLAKQKRFARNGLVPCIVSNATSDILVDEISLVENIERAPLHPLDQFRAFLAMREKGMTEEAIAAAFLVNVNVVKQRLRLASVSTKLLEVYAEDGMTLEQLMAFTVSSDHARQEQIWEAINTGWQKDSWQIRRMLTETTVRACDKRAVFIGIDAYEAAGGVVLRDLFQSDDGGWLEDVGLLDRLVAAKLKTVADEIAEEGWKWVEAALSLPYGATQGLREIARTPVEMTDEEHATRDALQAEYNRLSEQYDSVEELPEDIDRRLGEIEAAMEALDHRPVRYDPSEIAIAGAFITIDPSGKLIVDRGYVRPEDERPTEPERDNAQRTEAHKGSELTSTPGERGVSTIGGQSTPVQEEEEDGIKPLPERLVVELTAHRTLALRDAVADHPHVAMTALLHKLASDTFLHRPATGALDVNVRQPHFTAQADDLNDSTSAKAVIERHERWSDQVPADDEALWDWLMGLDDENRMALLAHCVSYSVTALYERPNPYSGSGVTEHELKVRLSQADRLARATGLEMAEAGWRPTVGNYLGRVTKVRILEAVREAKGERAAELIDHLKKGEMAKEAERLLAGTGWLPEPLRLANDGQAAPIDGALAEEPDVGALPDFLAEDDGAETEDEPAAASMIAAE